MQIICFNNHKFSGIGLVLLMSSVRDGTFWNSNKAFSGTCFLCEHCCSLKRPELWSWDDWQPEKVFKVGTGTTLTAWLSLNAELRGNLTSMCGKISLVITGKQGPSGRWASEVMWWALMMSAASHRLSQSFPRQQLGAFNETKQRYRASGSLSSLVLETRLRVH